MTPHILSAPAGRRSPAPLRASAGGLVLLVLLTGCGGPLTERAYEQLDRIFDEVQIPPSFELVNADDEGSFSPLDASGTPSQLRVYRVTGDPLQARSDFIDVLDRLGLSRRISSLSSRHREDNDTCVFTMAGDGLVFYGHLENHPYRFFGTGPVCPRRNWTEVFLWLSLDVAWDRFT